jgi:hypothetical protein
MIIEIKEEDRKQIEKAVLNIVENNKITYGLEFGIHVKSNGVDKNVDIKIKEVRC